MVFVPQTFISEYRAARKLSLLSSDGWWLNRWPLLAWMETFVKMAAWCFVPRIRSATTVEPVTPTRTAVTLVMFVASFLLTGAILDRLFYREVISMLFVFPNNWAHWSVYAALAERRVDGVALRSFLWLMFAGDVVKLVFFVVHGFEIKALAKYAVYSLVAFFAIMYALCLAIEYGYFTNETNRLHALCIKKVPQIFAYWRR